MIKSKTQGAKNKVYKPHGTSFYLTQKNKKKNKTKPYYVVLGAYQGYNRRKRFVYIKHSDFLEDCLVVLEVSILTITLKIVWSMWLLKYDKKLSL
jgi:hypothetical protein